MLFRSCGCGASSRGRRCTGVRSGDARLLEGRGGGGLAVGHVGVHRRGSRRRPETGGAAGPDNVHAQAMPTSAWACFPQTIDQTAKLTVSPCAKSNFPPLCRTNFSKIQTCPIQNFIEHLLLKRENGFWVIKIKYNWSGKFTEVDICQDRKSTRLNSSHPV